jgi:hypothetical protein
MLLDLCYAGCLEMGPSSALLLMTSELIIRIRRRIGRPVFPRRQAFKRVENWGLSSASQAG